MNGKFIFIWLQHIYSIYNCLWIYINICNIYFCFLGVIYFFQLNNFSEKNERYYIYIRGDEKKKVNHQ